MQPAVLLSAWKLLELPAWKLSYKSVKGWHREFDGRTSGNLSGLRRRTSSSEVDLLPAPKDVKVSFRQQVTFGSAKSKGSSQSEAARHPAEVSVSKWPGPGVPNRQLTGWPPRTAGLGQGDWNRECRRATQTGLSSVTAQFPGQRPAAQAKRLVTLPTRNPYIVSTRKPAVDAGERKDGMDFPSARA